LRALARTERRQQRRGGMRVGKVQADRSGLVQDQRLGVGVARVLDEDGNQPVRIERQVLSRLVRRLLTVDVAKLERLADLLENDVGDEARVAREVVKLQHGQGAR